MRTIRSLCSALLITCCVLLIGTKGVRAEKELRIGVQFGLGYLPIYVMRDAGLFEKHMKALGAEPMPVRVVNFTGGPQIQDGLLSQSLDIGTGGITVMLIAFDKTQKAGDQAMLGLTALSSVPYDLWTSDPALKSLEDLAAGRNKVGVPAIKVSVPALFLQMAAEKLYGPGKHGAFDASTVSLAQPDGAISLTAGGGTVDSYMFSPPFTQQMKKTGKVHRVWSSNELFGTPITALSTWNTARFRKENPKAVVAFVAAMRDAIDLIAKEPLRAAQIYAKAESSKLSPEFLAEVLADPDVRFTLAPENSVKVADFLSRVGTLKSKPASWKGYFFAELHDESGS